MKNVMYISCWVNPYVKVAQRLQEEHGYKPVFWVDCSIGTEKSQEMVLQSFPGIIYMKYMDAWKGRFPKNVEEKAQECYLDVDFLKRHAHHELQAIKMLDRVDQDLRSFNFMERQRHFRNMLKYWTAVIDLYKPDLVIRADIPHIVFDYVLYLLCEERHVPYITQHHTQFTNRFYYQKNNFYTLGDRFINDWHSYEGDLDVDGDIPNDIMSRYEMVNQDYELGAPSFMKVLEDEEKEMDKPWFMIKRWFKKFTTIYRPYLSGKPAGNLIIGLCGLDKRANMKYEESEGNIYQHEKMILKVNKYKKQLKEAYESLVTPPDYKKEEYVAFFLHYQPEATTCPGGDIFVDQRLCIELLLKNLPDNYKIYVKEHPHQFIKKHLGHTSRMRDLYDDLVKNKRVRLISTAIDSFEIINNAKAVCTITGTAGWEGIVRQKPVIVFGICWYENYNKGVCRITDEASAKNIISFIKNYKFDEHSLLAYLASVGKNTCASNYLNDFRYSGKTYLEVSEEGCVNGMVNLIVEQVEA